MSNGRTRLEIRGIEDAERGVYSGNLDVLQRYEIARIVSELVEPDRRLARRSYNVAAWTLAFSMGAFVVALVTYWLVATAS